MKMNVVLYEPEIPPNTGSIARTCAAVGARLHLVEPLGFSIDDKHLKRAGLDYWSLLDVQVHSTWDNLYPLIGTGDCRARLSARAEAPYTGIELPADDRALWLVFGPETRGLPDHLLASNPRHNYRIPIRSEARSLNLSNAVSIVVFDIFRRAGFPGLEQARSAK